MELLGKIKNFILGKRKIVRNKDTGTAIERYFKSFLHAVDGIIYSIMCEHNMIIIIVAALFTTMAGVYFSLNAYEWLFCITMFGCISATEFINTAIEAAIDLTTSEYNKLAKIAKDTASSATLILCVTAFIGALIIFVPKISELL